MIDIVDRIPGSANKYEITNSKGTKETVTIIRKDNPTKEGTAINREVLMAMQGFVATTTTFSSNGTITETNGKGDVLKTEFLTDGSIKETFTGKESGYTISKTTKFNTSGSIQEVIGQ